MASSAFQAAVVIPASGTPSYSADTNLGDNVPVLSAGADVSWVMPDTLETISEGVPG